MLAMLRNRNFALLWLGSITSLLGDWLLIIALPLYVYQRTGSALATGALAITETLPSLLFGSFAGVFVDRWNRKWTMIISDLLRAGALLPLFLIHGQDQIWIAYIFAFLQATISQFFTPAQGALIPLLIREEEITTANSLNSLGSQVTRVLGPLASGVLFGLFGLQWVIWIDCFAYLFSALMSFMVMVPALSMQTAPSTQPQEAQANPGVEWIRGLKLIVSERIVYLFIISGIAMVGDGFVRAISTPFLSQVASGNAIVLSWMVTAQGIGAILGALLLSRISRALSTIKLLAISAIAIGFLGSVEALMPLVIVVTICSFLIGPPIVFFFVSIFTELQKKVSDRYRGRIIGTNGTTNMLLYLVGMILSSLLATLVSVRYMILIGNIFYALAGITAWYISTNMMLLKKQSDSPESLPT